MTRQLLLRVAGAVSACAIVAAAYFAVKSSRPIAVQQTHMAPSQLAERAQAAIREPERSEIETEAVLPPSSLESSLKDYWGQQWPAVNEAMTREGVDPHTPFVLAPWEQVASELRSNFLPQVDKYAQETKEFYREWPDELTLPWLKQTFRVPQSFLESDIYRVEALVAHMNADIDALADNYAILVCAVVEQKWDQGNFVHVPYSTNLVPQHDTPKDIFFGKAMGSGSGWAIAMILTKSEYPDIAALKEEMQAKQVARDHEVRAFFARWAK